MTTERCEYCGGTEEQTDPAPHKEFRECVGNLKSRLALAIEAIEDAPHPEECRWMIMFRRWQSTDQNKHNAPQPAEHCDCFKQVLEKLK